MSELSDKARTEYVDSLIKAKVDTELQAIAKAKKATKSAKAAKTRFINDRVTHAKNEGLSTIGIADKAAEIFDKLDAEITARESDHISAEEALSIAM